MPSFDPFVLSPSEGIWWPASQWRRASGGHEPPDSWPRDYDMYARFGEGSRSLSDLIAMLGVPRVTWMLTTGKLRPVGTRYRWATVAHPVGTLDRRFETYGKAAARCGVAEGQGINLYIVPYDPAMWAGKDAP